MAMQTTTSTKTKSITKTKMLVATLALGAAATAFLMAPVRQRIVNPTTGTVTYVTAIEYNVLTAILISAVTSISK